MAITVDEFIEDLKKRYGVFTRRDPFEVLIFTVLSQRTKDANSYKASEQLFSRYNTPEEIADAPLKEIEKLIKPAGFYRVKANRIKEIARVISKTGMPTDLGDLLRLPGVGRKTANCVLVYGYGEPAIPVDIHVHRISNRLGFVHTRTPEETERELMKIIPKDKWILVNSLLVRFGQEICGARPKCWMCPLIDRCPYPDKKLK
ncbi:MAG: endonuclease III [Candidatus Diapherotrites archaeon]|nr:endonuclease III [Candidatus Diapherotrites archaeon]